MNQKQNPNVLTNKQTDNMSFYQKYVPLQSFYKN